MRPTLTRQGALATTLALALLGLGAGWHHIGLISLSTLLLTILLVAHLSLYRVGTALQQGQILFTWTLPQPTSNSAIGQAVPLRLVFKNHTPLPLRISVSQIVATQGLAHKALGARQVPPQTTAHYDVDVTPLCAAIHTLHGLAIAVNSPLHLFELPTYFPKRLSLRSLPSMIRRQARGGGMPNARLGLTSSGQRGTGHGGEFRELREHLPGDAFKHIAWQATARTGKLMTRDRYAETTATYIFAIDVGSDMRSGPIGQTPLDDALQAATQRAHALLRGGQRVAMLTYDTRLVASTHVLTRVAQLPTALELLVRERHAADADLWQAAPGTLLRQLARYAHQQFGRTLALRTPLRLDDPRWANVIVDDSGTPYHLTQVCNQLGLPLPATAPATAQLEALRSYCKHQGVEFRYRESYEHGERSRGLAAALAHAEKLHGTSVILLSELEGILEQPDLLRHTLGRWHQPGRTLELAPPLASNTPGAPPDAAAPTSPHSQAPGPRRGGGVPQKLEALYLATRARQRAPAEAWLRKHGARGPRIHLSRFAHPPREPIAGRKANDPRHHNC